MQASIRTPVLSSTVIGGTTFKMFDNLFGTVDDISDAFDAVGNFFDLMLDPDTYKRLFFVVFGAVLLIGAVTYGR